VDESHNPFHSARKNLPDKPGDFGLHSHPRRPPSNSPTTRSQPQGRRKSKEFFGIMEIVLAMWNIKG
jgi:hypothetical protein